MDNPLHHLNIRHNKKKHEREEERERAQTMGTIYPNYQFKKTNTSIGYHNQP